MFLTFKMTRTWYHSSSVLSWRPKNNGKNLSWSLSVVNGFPYSFRKTIYHKKTQKKVFILVFHHERQSNLFSYIRANIEITESSDFIQVDSDIFEVCPLDIKIEIINFHIIQVYFQPLNKILTNYMKMRSGRWEIKIICSLSLL